MKSACTRQRSTTTWFLILALVPYMGMISSVSAQDKPPQDPKSISSQAPQEVDLDNLRIQLSEMQKEVKKQAEAQAKIKETIEKSQNDRTELGEQLKNLESLKAQLESIQEIDEQVQLQKEGLADLLQKTMEKLNKQPLPSGYAETLKMLEDNAKTIGRNLKLNKDVIYELRASVLKMEASIRGMDTPTVLSTIHEFNRLRAEIKFLNIKGAIQLHGLSNDLAAFDKISSMEFDNDSKSLILFGDRLGKWLRVSLKFRNDGEFIGLYFHERGWIRKSGGKPNKPPIPLGDIESSAWFQGKLHLALDNGEIYRLNDNWVAEKLNVNLEGFKTRLIDKNREIVFSDSGIEGMTATEDGKKLICFAEKQSADSDQRGQNRQAWILAAGVKGGSIKPNKSAYKFDDDISKRHDIGGATTHKDKLIVVHKHFEEDTEINFVRISRFHMDDLANSKSGTVLFKAESEDLLDNTECIVSFEQNGTNYLALLTDNNGRSKQKAIFLLFELITSDKPASDKTAPAK